MKKPTKVITQEQETLYAVQGIIIGCIIAAILISTFTYGYNVFKRHSAKSEFQTYFGIEYPGTPEAMATARPIVAKKLAEMDSQLRAIEQKEADFSDQPRKMPTTDRERQVQWATEEEIVAKNWAEHEDIHDYFVDAAQVALLTGFEDEVNKIHPPTDHMKGGGGGFF